MNTRLAFVDSTHTTQNTNQNLFGQCYALFSQPHKLIIFQIDHRQHLLHHIISTTIHSFIMKIANAVLLMAAVGSANAQVSFDVLCLLLVGGGGWVGWSRLLGRWTRGLGSLLLVLLLLLVVCDERSPCHSSSSSCLSAMGVGSDVLCLLLAAGGGLCWSVGLGLLGGWTRGLGSLLLLLVVCV